MKLYSRIIHGLERRGLLNFLPDRLFLQLMFIASMGRAANLSHPKTFNEKLQWLKLHDRKPEYTTMVDKIGVKMLVSQKIGDKYVIPILGVWEKFDDIDFDRLPDQFVLKCSHDSGGLVICRDKSRFDRTAAKEKIEKCLKHNYYWHAREWPYKGVQPRILAEKYIHDDTRGENDNLIVYKIFNFEGSPKIIQVITNDKCPDESIDYFDPNWNLLDMRQNFPNSKIHLNKPKKLEEMLALSKKMSEGFHFLRVDFYEVSDQVLFSEFTFYTDAGFEKYYPEVWDTTLGNWVNINRPSGKNKI